MKGSLVSLMPRFAAEDVAVALQANDVEFLGRGAFGDTWRMGEFAVKIIVEDGYPAGRVIREISGLSRVSSRYVVKLLSTRVVQLGGRERPALIFEYVSGGDVQGCITSGSAPNLLDFNRFAEGLLTGIRDLHSSGTVHRDIKPGNICLRNGAWRDPVLLDLGLARNVSDSTITANGAAVGTAMYMAPEQLLGKKARKAVDLFAVGVTLRQVISGEHPFYCPGASYTIEEALKLIEAGPRPLSPSLNPSIVSLLDRLTSPIEHERGSAASALRRLEEVV